MDRADRLIDRAVLEALLRDSQVDLTDAEAAQASAARLQGSVPPEVTITPELDSATESYRLRIIRRRHGNDRLGYLDRDFLQSGDYVQLQRTAQMLKGLIGEGAYVSRGAEKHAIGSFPEALEWLLAQVQKGLTVQRYKGLGEMNPEQLWDTTMNPATRRLLRAQIEDIIAADEIFTTLMGDLVEPRRAFIESNALGVRNLDV